MISLLSTQLSLFLQSKDQQILSYFGDNFIDITKVYSSKYFRLIFASMLFQVCSLESYSVHGQTAHDGQLWNAAILDWNFKTNWLFELELDYNRLLSGGAIWREYAMQPSFEFYPNNSIDLFAGVYLSDTRQNDVEDTEEVRPLVGFRWNIIKPEKRVFLRTQFKFEYRIFKSVSSESKDNNGRLRARLDLFVPLTQKSYSTDNNLYAISWSEVFINFDNEIRERYQSTFRQYLGLGYRLSYSWRFEVDYVFQAAKDSITDEVPDTESNVVFLTIKYYIPRK